MSGGGGGGYSRGGREQYTPPQCEDISFDAQLTSPNPALVPGLRVAEVLDVSVATTGGRRVVQVTKGGQLLGGLVGPDASRIRDCMDNGHQYKATVLNVNSGQVLVRVEHV
ncbi:hypothetical protein RAMLITH_22740 [Ramlibacter sp. RBP-2]|uniref:Uncharacterized protein n=1 Tax=Ramlibacter lithotrophicus TaxID=2606681 RepID=A0A7X6DKE9_9BURK|nr:hypothetical protein [Ramlibacter lithotrophicus]NKE68643.1 hypothetical protein [Ramlibacter lithotrophicus]